MRAGGGAVTVPDDDDVLGLEGRLGGEFDVEGRADVEVVLAGGLGEAVDGVRERRLDVVVVDGLGGTVQECVVVRGVDWGTIDNMSVHRNW